MTTGPENDGRPITERQNDAASLRRLLAYSRGYRVAWRWHRLRVAGTFVLAAASPIVVIWEPGSAELLGAIAAGWLVAGRTALQACEKRSTSEAARAQELYETKLFGLPWNRAVAGNPPSPEDIERAASHINDPAPYVNWFTVDVDGLSFPSDVLLCQRQSAVWARWDQRAYAFFIAAITSTWFVVGVAIALAREMTLAAYLVKLFLPSAPAYLDGAELARAHQFHAARRKDLEDDITAVWNAAQGSDALPEVADCRRIQDAAFLVRRSGPRVPTWFYRARRRATERATVAGAAGLRDSTG